MDAWDLSGRVVIVTMPPPASTPRPHACCTAPGAHPVLAARRGDRLDALADELDGAYAVPTGLTDRAAVRRLADVTQERHGRIDGLSVKIGAAMGHPKISGRAQRHPHPGHAAGGVGGGQGVVQTFAVVPDRRDVGSRASGPAGGLPPAPTRGTLNGRTRAGSAGHHR